MVQNVDPSQQQQVMMVAMQNDGTAIPVDQSIGLQGTPVQVVGGQNIVYQTTSNQMPQFIPVTQADGSTQLAQIQVCWGFSRGPGIPCQGTMIDVYVGMSKGQSGLLEGSDLTHIAKPCSYTHILRMGASPGNSSPARNMRVPGAEFAYSIPEKPNRKKNYANSIDETCKYLVKYILYLIPKA